jgi:hypothetical protein
MQEYQHEATVAMLNKTHAKEIEALRTELEKVKAEPADRDCDTCDCGTCQVRADFATMTKDRDEWRQLSCEQHGDGMVAGTELHMLRQQLMRANEASARDLSALSNQVKSLTIELEAAVEVRRNVTKELTEYGDRACKAERERDIAIRGNGEAHYKLAASQQRIRELEQQNGKLRGELCKILEITYQVETDNLLYLLGLAEDVQKIARAALSVSLKPTSGTCQPDPSDMLKQAFKEAGIDVDFVDCTPKPEKGQGE